MDRLREKLERIDGRGYPAYKDIRGSYEFEDFELDIVHVQGDPFAAASRLAVRFDVDVLDLDADDTDLPVRRVGVEDGLLRSFHRALRDEPRGRQRGSGKSGRWGLVRQGQEILARSGCEIVGREVTVRFTLGLPAQGRRVQGREAARLLCERLPRLVEEGLLDADPDKLLDIADANEDQEFLRAALVTNQWVAFVADGAVLPRHSGIDDGPMTKGAVPWSAPDALRTEIDLPNAGKVTGAAIPRGVTLICGGGFHGKSTLLSALARSVYNHIPGDGRDLVVTCANTVQVRAEDGRSVQGVDISAFISDLPDGRDTTSFSTENASGSTSQAASIAEAVEMRASALLIDEDTSATNFMVRDRRMQELIATGSEPITPFVDRVRELSDDHGVSTILVVGGSGDYFDVADRVVVMDRYRPALRSDEAREIAKRHPSNRLAESRRPLVLPADRRPRARSFDARAGAKNRERVRARESRSIQIGNEEIDISLIAQIVDDGQARTLGDMLVSCGHALSDDALGLRTLCRRIVGEYAEHRLSRYAPRGSGDRVAVRPLELAAAINRLRSLRID
jgi:predicted ABC-class ATPase